MRGAAAGGARAFATVALTLAVLAAGTGCAHSGPDETRPDGEFVVGASLELTGADAAAGTAARNALRIAVEDLNATLVAVGDRHYRVRLAIDDNRSDPTAATAQVGQLYHRDQAVAMIGGGGLDTGDAIVRAAQRYRLPLLSLGERNELVRPVDTHRFVFKLPPNPDDVARLLTGQVRRDGTRRTTILAMSGPYGDEGVAAVAAALGDAGVPAPAVVRFPATARSTPDTGASRSTSDDAAAATPDAGLAQAAAQVTAGRPGAVVVWSVSPAAGRAAGALRAAGFPGQLLFNPGAGGEDTLSAAHRSAVEDSILIHPAVFDLDRPVGNDPTQLALRRFRDQYVQLYGAFDGAAPYARDALDLVAAAAGTARSLRPDPLRDAIEHTTFEGLAGRYEFTPSNHGGLAADGLTVFRCQRGQWVRSP